MAFPDGKDYSKLSKAAEVARFCLYCARANEKYLDADKSDYGGDALRADLVRELKKVRTEVKSPAEWVPQVVYEWAMAWVWKKQGVTCV